MTDRALLGVGNPGRSQSEPARIPGHGSVPAPVARAWLRNADDGSVWLRRRSPPRTAGTWSAWSHVGGCSRGCCAACW